MSAVRPSIAAALAAALPLALLSPHATAQTTPCEAIFEPQLAAGLSEAAIRFRLDWRTIANVSTTAYTLDAEKASPFDPARLKMQTPPPATPAPPSPITGYASALDVRCNASAASATDAVKVVYSAGALRFKEGRGPWSDALSDAPIAVYLLMRAPKGWTVLDRSAEGAVLPPDARRSAPHDTLARALAASAWSNAPKPGRRRPSR